MILKAGTYRFNDVLEHFVVEQELLIIECPLSCNGVSYVGFVIPPIQNVFVLQYIDSEGLGTNIYFSDALAGFNAGWQGDYKTHTLTQDIDVNDTFGTWYIASTNYNEVNAKPLAEITYNGETIAQLNAGETATLSCEGMKMVSDVVVKIESGYVKPSGSLTITESGTYDVSKYAKVVIDI